MNKQCNHSGIWPDTAGSCTWWEDAAGDAITAYFPTASGTCTNGTCACDTNDGTWRADGGYVTDPNDLPIKIVHVGDTGNNFASDSEMAKMTIGPLLVR